MTNLKEKNINDIKKLDYDILTYLRETTMLSPIDFLKVAKAKEVARKLTEVYKKHEPNDLIGIDYSAADELEYALRLKTYEKSMYKFWVQYGQEQNLSDFCQRCLHDEMEENIHKTR